MNRESESTEYDLMYDDGGYEGVYHLPYHHSSYYPLFKEVLKTLDRHHSRSVLEVGCGTGAFAHLLIDKKAEISYRGFDFSPVAVARAIKRLNRPELFYVGDAKVPECYQSEADTIVCTEVLEHIIDDLGVIENWKEDVFCVCSVPSFDADNHVRHFRSKDDVISRYEGLIDIKSVVRITKPALTDLSWQSRLKAIRWNRYRPTRLRAILGLATFEQLGGWYVFSGIRKRLLVE